MPGVAYGAVLWATGGGPGFWCYTVLVFKGWLARLDRAGHRMDARWYAWLDRRLSPVFDLFFAGLPIWFLILVILLALATVG